VRWALAQVEAGAREADRTLDELTLCARVGCSVDDDRAWAREEMKPYAAVAAKTSFDAIPADQLPDDLLEEGARAARPLRLLPAGPRPGFGRPRRPGDCRPFPRTSD
jgi:hypothetical protein